MSTLEPRDPEDPSLSEGSAPSGQSSDAPTAPLHEESRIADTPAKHTRISGYWAAVIVGLLILIVLIVFILQNGHRAEVTFFGAHTRLPLGVALLLASVIGGVVVALVGVARILQLRSQAFRTSRSHSRRRR